MEKIDDEIKKMTFLKDALIGETRSIKKTCPVHGEFDSSVISVNGASLFSSCEKCAEEKEAAEKALTLSGNKKLEEKWKAMGIEPIYYLKDIDNFKTYILKTTLSEESGDDEDKVERVNVPELVQKVATIRRLVSGEIKKILMTGDHGTGKTHLAIAALKIITGQIKTMYEIGTEIRSTYTLKAKETERDIVERLSELPLLVIDEIGRTKGSDSELNWLSAVIDKRHCRSLPIILISNRHVKKDCPGGGCPQCLDNFLGSDVIDRLKEDAVLLRFSGESHRGKNK